MRWVALALARRGSKELRTTFAAAAASDSGGRPIFALTRPVSSARAGAAGRARAATRAKATRAWRIARTVHGAGDLDVPRELFNNRTMPARLQVLLAAICFGTT